MNKNTYTETEQFSHFLNQYGLQTSAVLFIFVETSNVILIIIITCNMDIRKVPSMHVLNVAISDMINLTLFFFYDLANRILDFRLHDGIVCAFLPFCYRMSFGLILYAAAVFSIQRYRITVNPSTSVSLQIHQGVLLGLQFVECGLWLHSSFLLLDQNICVLNLYFCCVRIIINTYL